MINESRNSKSNPNFRERQNKEKQIESLKKWTFQFRAKN